MREIETELGMWKNWYAFLPDLLEDKKKQKLDLSSLPKRKLEIINELRKHYAKPAGYKGLERISIIIMLSWVFLIIREASLVFNIPVVSQWFLN